MQLGYFYIYPLTNWLFDWLCLWNKHWNKVSKVSWVLHTVQLSECWLASHCQCSSDVSCCWIEVGTEDEVCCVISLHPIIIHIHVSVETWASVDIKAGTIAGSWRPMSSIYDVCNTQTVKSSFVTCCHPETWSQVCSKDAGCYFTHVHAC